jgi:serine/threonine protein kinase
LSQPTARKAPADPPASQRGGDAVVSGAQPAARDVDPMIGRVLDGRFTIEAKLGAGSMGAVYRAKQHAMGRNVAIKILRSDRALDEGSRARFLREARANSLLASPHTVTVFDFGQADNGDFFLAMELLEGESVGQRLQREKRLGPEAAVDVCRQALRSLTEAHAKGIIHRDLKPDNLFFARSVMTDESGARKHEESVKVVDFGIAKMLLDDDAPMNAVETQAGTVFGTPRYMSPEQAQGKPLDARSDLYSLGVILYHMLTGRPPFTDDDAIVVMARHIKTPPKRPIESAPQANIPPALDEVVMRILAKEPHQRPASAEAMSQELARAMNLSSTTSGMRVSVSSGSTPPPPGVLSLPQLPPVGGAPNIAIPPAPMSDGYLSNLPSSTESLQIAAGVGRRSRKKTVLGAIGAVVAIAIVAAVVLGTRAPPPRAPVVTREAPPESTIPPIPPPTGAANGALATGAPAATGTERTIPEANVTDLPRARGSSAWAPPSPPPPRRETPHSKPQPAPAPAASASGHYGLFE